MCTHTRRARTSKYTSAYVPYVALMCTRRHDTYIINNIFVHFFIAHTNNVCTLLYNMCTLLLYFFFLLFTPSKVFSRGLEVVKLIYIYTIEIVEFMWAPVRERERERVQYAEYYIMFYISCSAPKQIGLETRWRIPSIEDIPIHKQPLKCICTYRQCMRVYSTWRISYIVFKRV